MKLAKTYKVTYSNNETRATHVRFFPAVGTRKEVICRIQAMCNPGWQFAVSKRAS